MLAKREGEIDVICKRFDKNPQVLGLNKVQYMSKASINLISER